MSRTILYHCSRCGASITDARRSVLEVKAGPLAKLHDEPWLDVCGPCGDRFEDWLRSGKEAPQTGLPATPKPVMVDAAGRVA
jgi:hypothetical protein